MKQMIAGLIVLLSLCLSAEAAPYVYMNTTGGAMGGGIGFDLPGGRAIDFSATAASGVSWLTHAVYADYFIGCWGVGVTMKKPAVNAEPAFDLNVQYALEQPLTDKISIGASFTLINYDTTKNADPTVTLLPSLAPYFKISF